MEVSALRQAVCTFIYSIGVVTMMSADCQKFYTLKFKKGLISDGWFYSIRNTNYLGEMMIYGSFAGLCKSFIPCIILAYVWGIVFYSNMMRKEKSLSQKEGWEEYSARSSLVLPFSLC